MTCLPDLPPMRISVEAIISHRDLALVRDMGTRPGDELQVVHPLHLLAVFPIPIANLTLFLRETEALQGKKRPGHVFAHPLGHFLDDRPKEAVFLLEAALIFSQEPIEVMEQHSIEDSLFRMPRTIHSRHGGRIASRNGPRPWIGPPAPERTGRSRAQQAESG